MSNISKDDYNDKCCAVGGKENVPIDRVLAKIDECFSRDDYEAAERHLKYWIESADASGDEHGLLFLMNECIGLYRKIGEKEKSLAFSRDALALCGKLELDGTVTMATTCINAATAYNAFGDPAAAIPLYEKAKELYEALLPAGDGRLGGLYNNMALAVMAAGEYDRARKLFSGALRVMESLDGGEPGVAITYCNLADLIAAERGEADGEAEIGDCLEKAMSVLDGVSSRTDGEYAYACEKCAPTFGHYGYFTYEDALEKRARSIYEGH